MGNSVHQIFDATAGYGAAANLIAAGDPDVHRFGDRWWMFFGAAHDEEKVNLFSASLPVGDPVSSPRWSVTTDPENPRRALPLAEHPVDPAWDEWLHTPCYVRGVDPGVGAEVERLYYTGSGRSSAVDEPGVRAEDRAFAIGALERSDGGWVRRGTPILIGSEERPSVLEPTVRYLDGLWHAWYMATPHEAGEGELPDYRIEYRQSADGIGRWSDPVVLFDERDNYFDAAVLPLDGDFGMVVARAPNMYGHPEFPSQGLWWLRSGAPSGRRADWSERPEPILDGRSAARWYGGAIYAPFPVRGDTEADRDTVSVFFTGAPVPDPDPYVLSIGRIDLALSELP